MLSQFLFLCKSVGVINSEALVIFARLLFVFYLKWSWILIRSSSLLSLLMREVHHLSFSSWVSMYLQFAIGYWLLAIGYWLSSCIGNSTGIDAHWSIFMHLMNIQFIYQGPFWLSYRIGFPCFPSWMWPLKEVGFITIVNEIQSENHVIPYSVVSNISVVYPFPF